MSQVQLLYRLQKVDSEILVKKKRLSEVLASQKETAELSAARQRAAAANAKLDKWQARQRDLNLELSGLNNKAKVTEQRLYSGKVKNPKELADLQHEFEALGRRRSVLEEEAIEALILIEDAQQEKSGADENLNTVQAGWKKNQAGLLDEQGELATRLRDLLLNRQKQTAQIDPATLAEYERMLKQKGGLAVAALKLNRCQGCHITVSANKAKRADRGEMVYCGGCGRILCPV